MGIFANDNTQGGIEGRMERAMFGETDALPSPTAELLSTLEENSKLLEGAIMEGDPQTLEALRLQVAEYQDEAAEVRTLVAEIAEIIEQEL